jgi:ATP-dependent DNA helicase MPH1
MEFSVGMAYNSLLDLGQGSNKKEPAKTTQSKISRDPNYIAIMKEIERQRNDKGAFPTHPKMEKLRMLAIQHFAGAEIDEEEKAKPGSKPAESMTKMIVFCTYRDCVDEIVDMLNDQQPMIRAHRFIGQGTDKRGGKGVTQKAQIGVGGPWLSCSHILIVSQVIRDFKEGKYNVIVSTSIGEEGLDIGEVDIIVCYDAQKAAIRMVRVESLKI